MKGARDSSIVNVSGKAVVLEEFINSLMKKKNTTLNNPAKENVNSCAMSFFSVSRFLIR